ncbi:MAG: hypothetical protein EBS05_20255, partial [Proteobacteria bacterium]|nr:hypothetical protein [Pseudomonadota bacterium]
MQLTYDQVWQQRQELLRQMQAIDRLRRGILYRVTGAQRHRVHAKAAQQGQQAGQVQGAVLRIQRLQIYENR